MNKEIRKLKQNNYSLKDGIPFDEAFHRESQPIESDFVSEATDIFAQKAKNIADENFILGQQSLRDKIVAGLQEMKHKPHESIPCFKCWHHHMNKTDHDCKCHEESNLYHDEKKENAIIDKILTFLNTI